MLDLTPLTLFGWRLHGVAALYYAHATHELQGLGSFQRPPQGANYMRDWKLRRYRAQPTLEWFPSRLPYNRRGRQRADAVAATAPTVQRLDASATSL